MTSGFSLVEVTLAMMVMAVGILGIMVLFPSGLQQNERSIADTHAAFFAEEVFGGLRIRAQANWTTTNLPVASASSWSNIPLVHASSYPNFSTNRYLFPSEPYQDHALRYTLVVTNAGASGLRKSATLLVWPGEFGTTNDPSVFYAEFFSW